MALTRRQKEFLDFLIGFTDTKGYSPSYEEIACALDLASLATVHKHVSALETKGYLRRGFNQSRSIEVSPKYLQEHREHKTARLPAAPDVPLLGRIAAGSPVEAIQGNERLTFQDFVADDSTFALEVRGESMIEDHICNGDYVLVERKSEAKDGDIVVALIDGTDATLKRFYREPDGFIRLQPANSSMRPIRVTPAALQIQGRVLAVLRKFK